MKIAIIGCGNMGLAYARSFLQYNLVSKENLLLVGKDVSKQAQLEKLALGKTSGGIDKSIGEYDIVILAVKPQDFINISPLLKKSLSKSNMVLSIMAGKKISFLEEALGHTNIIRAMPNAPAQFGMGITAFASGKEVPLEQLRKVENLLNSTGRTIFMEDENLLDAVTALSGSGPAYFFYIVQSMIEAGKKMGLEESVAAILVKQTMLGSFILMNSSSKTLDELIKAVASKGGTTEAAFRTFNEFLVGERLVEGILAADKRAKELSNG